MMRIAVVCLSVALAGGAVAADQPAVTEPPAAAGLPPAEDALRERLIGRWATDSADECTDGEGITFYRAGVMVLTHNRRQAIQGVGSWQVSGSTVSMQANQLDRPAGPPQTLTYVVRQDLGDHLQGDLTDRGRTRQEQLFRCP